MIVPVNLRYADGSRNARLPDHDFGATNVIVNPLIEHRVKNLDNCCREDLQDLVDEENNAVLQADSNVLWSLSRTLAENDTAVILLIAPHMYSRNKRHLA